ncbi:MAG: hypothetical protein JW969_09355 [Spirochaetales bacterium]|nr:hypothetical protein [Spirochaetales bacterium]
MEHPNLLLWEKKLKEIFEMIDDYLEDKYGDRYPLHPARSLRGTTANKEDDGLFDVGASFSAGFGSDLGPGYVIEVRLATLSDVPDDIMELIRDDVIRLLNEELPEKFPNRELHVARDGTVYKIFGDLNLNHA